MCRIPWILEFPSFYCIIVILFSVSNQSIKTLSSCNEVVLLAALIVQQNDITMSDTVKVLKKVKERYII